MMMMMNIVQDLHMQPETLVKLGRAIVQDCTIYSDITQIPDSVIPLMACLICVFVINCKIHYLLLVLTLSCLNVYPENCEIRHRVR